MDEAVQRTYDLARSLLDYLPGLRGSLEAQRGLDAEGRRVPCSTCGARGRVTSLGVPCALCAPRVGPQAPPPHRPRHGCTPCLVCDGSGWRKRRKSERPVDEYAGEEVGTEQKVISSPKDTQRQLDHVGLVLKLMEGDETIEEAWEEARIRQFQQGSYAELIVALQIVSERWPGRFSLLWRCVVLGQVDLDHPEKGVRRLSDGALAELNATLHYIAHELMPATIRVPRHMLRTTNGAKKESIWRGRSEAHNLQRHKRDELIRYQRFTLEWETNRIARFHALDRRRVNQILAVASQR